MLKLNVSSLQNALLPLSVKISSFFLSPSVFLTSVRSSIYRFSETHDSLGELSMIRWASGVSLTDGANMICAYNFVLDFIMKFSVKFIFLVF